MAKKLWIESISNPGVVYQETSPNEDCVDQTASMVHWDMHGQKALQYQQVRNILWTLLIAEIGANFAGWGSLSLAKKLIAAKWGLAPYALRLSVITEGEDIINFKELLEQTAGTRKENLFGRDRIVEEMRQYIGLNYFRTEVMTKVDIDDLYATIKGYITDFIASNSPSFKQWLTNAVGTVFETDGYAQKSYYHSEVVTALIDIYNGNY